MKILFCQPSLNYSGSEKSLLEIVRALHRNTNHELFLLSGADGPIAAEFEKHVTKRWVTRAPVLRRSLAVVPSFLWSFFTVCQAVRRIKRKTGVSLLYVNTLMFPQALIAGRLNGLQCVVQVHETVERYPWLYYQVVLALAVSLAERIVCVCRFILGQRGILFRGRLKRKAHIVYNSISCKHPVTVRAVGDTLKLVAVMGITRPKGAMDLVPFAVALKRRLGERPFEIKVVGSIADPKMYKEIEADIIRHDLGDRLTLCGETSDLTSFYEDAHIFLHPSHADVFPMVLLEAACFSLPAISTDAGGCPEAVEDGKTGFIVPVGDYAKMADKVYEIASDETLYGKLSAASYRRYRENFTPAHMLAQLRSALDGLI